jgi:hypothetical protein
LSTLIVKIMKTKNQFFAALCCLSLSLPALSHASAKALSHAPSKIDPGKEKTYSCDPTIDKWVKDHLSMVVNLNRQEIIKYNVSCQKAIFRAMNAGARARIWQEKFQAAINDNDTYTPQDKEYIKKLAGLLRPEMYDDTTATVPAVLKNWLIEVKTNGKWNDEKLAIFAYTFFTKAEFLAIEGKEPVRGEPDCDCTQGTTLSCSNLPWNHYHKCMLERCNYQGSGCGFLGFEQCEGRCLDI